MSATRKAYRILSWISLAKAVKAGPKATVRNRSKRYAMRSTSRTINRLLK